MSNNPAKILLVEDNPGDVYLLRLALDYHKEDYELELLRDGEQAIRFVQDQRDVPHEAHPCVMVLDMNLPKHDGHAVLTAVRREPSLEHVKVVAVSTVINPRDEPEIKRLGVRLYRAKPMELNDWIALAGEILAICREHLRMSAFASQ